MPVRNGLHVWSVYRVADAAFLPDGRTVQGGLLPGVW